MITLTQKQEKFVKTYLKNGCNASEAYRAVYATTARDSTVRRNVHEVLHSKSIQARLMELQQPVIQRIQYTFQMHIENLQKLRDVAIGTGQVGAGVAAEKAIGAALGYHRQELKIDATIRPGEPEQKRGLSPETQILMDRIRAARPQRHIPAPAVVEEG